MLCPDGYLADFIALDTALIEGRAKTMPTTAGFGFAPDWGEADTFSAFRPLVRAEYGWPRSSTPPKRRGKIRPVSPPSSPGGARRAPMGKQRAAARRRAA